MSVRRPDARERRTVAIGATVAAVALFVAFGVVPAARRWSDREAAIGAARDRVARLAGLAQDQDKLVAASLVDPPADRLHALRGRTPALAASELQALLQEQARLSRVSVERLEVSDVPGNASTPGARVSASLSATTDIYGVADLLTRLQSSPVLLAVAELQVSSNPVMRGNLLQVALTVRAPIVVEP
jgi:hypothetical protein